MTIVAFLCPIFEYQCAFAARSMMQSDESEQEDDFISLVDAQRTQLLALANHNPAHAISSASSLILTTRKAHATIFASHLRDKEQFHRSMELVVKANGSTITHWTQYCSGMATFLTLALHKKKNGQIDGAELEKEVNAVRGIYKRGCIYGRDHG